MELTVKSYASQSAHNAMIDAIVAQELRKQQAARAAEEAKKAEARRRELRELRMRLALANAKNERITGQRGAAPRFPESSRRRPGQKAGIGIPLGFQPLIEKADRAYRPPEKRPVRDALLVLYAYAILIAAAAVREIAECGVWRVECGVEKCRARRVKRSRKRRKQGTGNREQGTGIAGPR